MEYDNWYVIQVQTGKEEKTAEEIRRLVPESVITECFIPRSERLRKAGDKWIKQGDIMFRGYVFIISDYITEVSSHLRSIPDFARLLGREQDSIYAIYRDEAAFIDTLGGKAHSVDMSYGVIVGDKIIVNQGPLAGHEAIIKKIDRHKRSALISIPMFSRTVDVSVGLEIVSKT